jgi:hypothetical protein
MKITQIRPLNQFRPKCQLLPKHNIRMVVEKNNLDSGKVNCVIKQIIVNKKYINK